LTVEGNEQNFLLPQIIVAISRRIGLESKTQPMLVLTYNFATATSLATSHKL